MRHLARSLSDPPQSSDSGPRNLPLQRPTSTLSLPSYQYVLLSIAHGMTFCPLGASVVAEVLEEIRATAPMDR